MKGLVSMTRLDIKALASSSEGNAYLINDGITNLLIECGIPLNEIKIKSDFFNPKIDGCLISHSHKDHAGNDIFRLMYYGVDCYMAKPTIAEVYVAADNLKRNVDDYLRSRVKEIEHNKKFSIGTFDILPLEMNHDVYCLGFYLYSNHTKESVFFATDTHYIPYRMPSMDYIMVEANYDLNILNQRIIDGYIDPVMKKRLVNSHMEISNTIKWLEEQDLTKTRKIYLLHLSHGSSNEQDFKKRVIELTGIPVEVCG